MENYNSIIESKNKLTYYFSKLFPLPIKNEDGEIVDEVVIKDIIIEEPKYDFNECLKYQQNYSYNVVIFLVKKIQKIDIGKIELSFPKFHEGTYLSFESGKAKQVTSINVANIRSPILISTRKDKIIFRNSFTIYGINSESPVIEFLSSGLITFVKTLFDFKNVPNSYNTFDDFSLRGAITDVEVLSNKLEELKLNSDSIISDEASDLIKGVIPVIPEVFSKSAYLLDKLPSESNKLNFEELNEVLNSLKDNPEKCNKVSIFDIKVDVGGINFFNSLLNYSVYSRIKRRFYEELNRFDWIDNGFIQNKIDSYFRGQEEESSTIQTSVDTNATAYLSQSKKIYFKFFDNNKYALSYSKGMMGIIDPVKTHEGANANIRNELARDVSISNQDIEITVLDKYFNKVKLTTIKYYLSKILTNDSFDYETNSIILNDNGEISYTQYGAYHTTKDIDSYDYIRMDKDATLTYGSALIPMVNRTDPVRLAMGTAMLDQAIPIVGGRPPIVSTGMEKIIFNDSGHVIKSKVNGEVVEITEDFIKIIDEEGKDNIVLIPSPVVTSKHTSNFYQSQVKIGDKVKINQPIIASNSFKNDQLALTAHLNIAYAPYYGYTYEDGVAITQKAAYKLGHQQKKTIEIPIFSQLDIILDKDRVTEKYFSEDKDALKNLTQFGLPKIGESYKEGEVIVAFMEELDVKNDRFLKLRKILDEAMKMSSDYYKLIKHKVEPGITECYIEDVRVYFNQPSISLESAQRYYNQLRQKRLEKVEKSINKEIPQEDVSYITEYARAVIQIDVLYIHPVRLGDKLSNRFGTKSCVTHIIPDDQVVYDEEGNEIDLFWDPDSVVGRKNLSQIWEVALGKAAVKAYQWAIYYKSQNDYDSIRKVLNLINMTDRFNDFDNNQIDKLMEQGYFQVEVSAIDRKFDQKSIKYILDALQIPLDCKSKLRFPNGKLTRNGIVTGPSNIMRLEFLADEKAKATSKYGNREFVYGLGKSKSGGQRIGEQEVRAFLSHGNYEILNKLSGSSGKDVGKSIQQQLNLLGLIIR